MPMFSNYLKIAFRHLWKNRTFSLINIAGLSVGMAACLLILQYVSFELSYDQFNTHAEDIYRVYNDRYQQGKLIQHGTITYSAIGKAMQDDFPEVVNHTRIEFWGSSIVTCQTKKVSDMDLAAVDSTFLDIFSYPLLAGDRHTALVTPYSIILTENLAASIFEGKPADWSSYIGRTLQVGIDSLPYKVTGICKDVPENSHLSFDALVSWTTMLSGKNPWKEANYDFTQSDFWHYIQLRHGTDPHTVEAKLPAFSARHFQGTKVSGSEEKFHLQPLSRAHLYSDFVYEIGQTASATVVWSLLIVAILIIVIAWVNYINLSTAKSLERAREVGVRKVSGATRASLIRQFLIESLLINLLSLILALCIVLLAQSGLNRLVGHHLSLNDLLRRGMQGYNIVATLGILLLTGILISGFYPALVLSSFKPALVLKGKFSSSARGAWLRKGLVVLQFSITVVLIIGSLVVYRQIKYANEQDLGMNISHILIIKPPVQTFWDSTFINRENSCMDEMAKLSGVSGVCVTDRVAGEELGRNFEVRRLEAPEKEYYTTRNMQVSSSFLDVYGIKLVAGRNFERTDYSPNRQELHNIILNESAVRLLGYESPKAAIGRTIITGDKKWDVIGVVADVHQKSLRFAMEPTKYQPVYGTRSSMSVRVSSNQLPTIIDGLRKKYDAFFPGNVFEYYFLDEAYNEQYNNDRLFGKVFGLFSALAVLIACLGLFGLSLFATMQRTREIGVRKVLGASIGQIVFLLSKDFVRLIVLADLIAFPIAWFIMHNWLKDFAYRIDLAWGFFATAGGAALLIALLTLSFEAIKAAGRNPVKALRTE